MTTEANDSERDARLYQRAEAAAKAGNARMADALQRLHQLKARMQETQSAVQKLVDDYAKLERSIIEAAADLEPQ